MEMNLKELPNNVQAEKELLSWIMNDKEDLTYTAGILKANDFYIDRHQSIYNAILGLYATGSVINQVTLIEALGAEETKKITISYIAGLVNESVWVDAKDLVSIIEDKSFRRRIIKESQKAIQDAMNDKIKVGDIASQLQNGLMKQGTRKPVLSDDEVMTMTLDSIQEKYNRNGQLPGMKSGFKNFDLYTKGFKKKNLVILGAEPGMGKTLVSLNLGEGLSNNGYKVLFFAMEQDEIELGTIRMASQTMIDMRNIDFGKLTERDFMALADYANKKTKQNNFFMDTNESQDLNSIISKIRAVKMTKGLDIVFIDHLGLIDIGECYNSAERSEKIGNISRQLKKLSKELDICIVLTSQLSTGDMKGRADKRPQAYDLAGSKRLREDADVIFFCYRDSIYNEEADKSSLELVFRKFRGNPLMNLEMLAKMECQRMIDKGNI